jgi:hypothetical protein
MSGNTRKYDRFEYYLEDLDCRLCLHYQGKKLGCKLDIPSFRQGFQGRHAPDKWCLNACGYSNTMLANSV